MVATLLLFAGLLSPVGVAHAADPPIQILQYGPTTGGLVGLTPNSVTTTWNIQQWGAATTADFRQFDVIAFGDQPTCFGATEAATLWQTAIDTRSIWSAAITGNVFIAGTDPDYHGKTQFVTQGAQFAGSGSGTGLYASLSCAFESTATPVAVDLLGGLGNFKTLGVGNCPSSAHKIADHQSLLGLDDAYLSGWNCSAHEGFTTWPSDFTPLVMITDAATQAPNPYVAGDGTVGLPYVLARGASSIPLGVTPLSASRPVGQTHYVSATLTNPTTGLPVSGVHLFYRVTSGPNAGATNSPCNPLGCASTDANGVQQLSLNSSAKGVDSFEVWADSNNNGTKDAAEPVLSASVKWLQTVDYIALGDSYSAGEGIEPYDNSVNLCHRSDQAYSRKLVLPGYSAPIWLDGLGTQSSIACSGARTFNFYHGGTPQHIEPAQLDSLEWQTHASTADLATMTLGGNDVDFATVLRQCAFHACLASDFKPVGGVLFTDWLQAKVDSLGAPLSTSFSQVRTDAPAASVIVSGYPHLFPDTPEEQGCVKLAPFSGEQTYLNQMGDLLNNTVRTAAAQAGVHYVDVAPLFEPHTICTYAGESSEWLNAATMPSGFTLGVGPGSFHPNAAGQQGYATAIQDYMQQQIAAGAPLADTGLPLNPSPVAAPAGATAAAVTGPLGSLSELSIGATSGTTKPACRAPGFYAAGQRMTVSGEGFTPSTSVSLRIYPTPTATGTDLGTFTTDSKGLLTTTVKIPSGIAVGDAEITAVGSDVNGGSRVLENLLGVVANSASCDTIAPTVTLGTPGNGSTYDLGKTVQISYSCVDDANGTGVASCLVSPAGAQLDTSTNGTKQVTVTGTDNAGNTSTVTNTYTVVAGVPVVQGLSPQKGPSSGGTVVTINGWNFGSGSTVKFGAVAATSVTRVSASQLTAVVPAGTAGTTVNVSVTTNKGTSVQSSGSSYTYFAKPTVKSISPTSGPIAGGTTVTVTGTGFVSGDTSVAFGTRAGTSLTIVSATKLTVKSPSGSGTVDITVKTPGGTSTTLAADRFKYV